MNCVFSLHFVEVAKVQFQNYIGEWKTALLKMQVSDSLALHPKQVPPDLQNEVLMSLLETDPDVVDYLLRRKASQWS